jgi:hypothetical protein
MLKHTSYEFCFLREGLLRGDVLLNVNSASVDDFVDHLELLAYVKAQAMHPQNMHSDFVLHLIVILPVCTLFEISSYQRPYLNLCNASSSDLEFSKSR